jgi:hypothetical protein
VLPEIDIWRAAQLMLKRYGEKALGESAARADELALAGDDDGATTWRRIMAGVTEFGNKIPHGLVRQVIEPDKKRSPRPSFPLFLITDFPDLATGRPFPQERDTQACIQTIRGCGIPDGRIAAEGFHGRTTVQVSCPSEITRFVHGTKGRFPPNAVLHLGTQMCQRIPIP